MTRVPRYGASSRVAIEVQPDAPINTGKAKQFEALRKGFDAANEFIYPAVEQEQIAKGEEEALEAVNSGTFELRKPFTIRSKAFNTTAEKVIENRATIQLDEGVRAAMKKADGNIGVLEQEMEKLRSKILGELPDIPGLDTDIQTSWERNLSASRRQTTELAERRAIAAQKQAAGDALEAAKQSIETLGLTGGTADELAAELADQAEALVKFGPRGEFTVNGVTYEADPTRSGILSANQVAGQIEALEQRGHKVMLESEFLRSETPGSFAREFQERVFAGQSPFDAGTSLEMIRSFNSRAHTYEAQRRSAAAAAEKSLRETVAGQISPYVELSEAGVYTVIPDAMQAELLAAASPYPDLQQELEQEFAVAQAFVDTQGMSGPELLRYTKGVREQLEAGIGAGEIDLEGAAVIKALEGRVKKALDAIDSSTIGLSVIEQLTEDGELPEDVDFDGMIEQADGKPELLEKIAVIKAFLRDAVALRGENSNEREAQIQAGYDHIAALAKMGKGLGAEARMTLAVLDRLDAWSDALTELARKDPVAFAKAAQVPLETLAEAEGMAEVGAVVVSRVRGIEAAAAREGVSNLVPLTDMEVTAIVEVFDNSTRSEKAAFLGQIATLGPDRAAAVFGRIGQSSKGLLAAGAAQLNNNAPAADTILRGINAPKVPGGEIADVTQARQSALGEGLLLFNNASLNMLDEAAMAYAKGKAMMDGKSEIDVGDLEDGYLNATGRDRDGTGGLQVGSRTGPVVLPSGVDVDEVDRGLRFLNDEVLSGLVGKVVDRSGREITADELTSNIAAMRPHPKDQNVLIPVDEDGGVFGTVSADGEIITPGILTFTIEDLIRIGNRERSPGEIRRGTK